MTRYEHVRVILLIWCPFELKKLVHLKELRHTSNIYYFSLIENHIPKTLHTRDHSRAWTPLLNLHFNYLILIFTFLVLVQINVIISALLYLLAQITIHEF